MPLQWSWAKWNVPDSPLNYQPAILLFMGYLVWARREELAFIYQETRHKPRGGLGSVWAGCALIVLSQATKIVALAMVGLVVILAGVVLLCFGRAMLRALTVPLLFLCTMIPLPDFLIGQATQTLQLACTRAAGQVLEGLNVVHRVQGNLLLLPGYRLEVTAPCSGVSILLPVVVLTLWWLILLRGRFGQTTFLLTAAVTVALLMNVLRITAMGLLGAANPHLADRLHDANGLVFTLLAFLPLFPVSRAIGLRKPCAPTCA